MMFWRALSQSSPPEQKSAEMNGILAMPTLIS